MAMGRLLCNSFHTMILSWELPDGALFYSFWGQFRAILPDSCPAASFVYIYGGKYISPHPYSPALPPLSRSAIASSGVEVSYSFFRGLGQCSCRVCTLLCQSALIWATGTGAKSVATPRGRGWCHLRDHQVRLLSDRFPRTDIYQEAVNETTYCFYTSAEHQTSNSPTGSLRDRVKCSICLFPYLAFPASTR